MRATKRKIRKIMNADDVLFSIKLLRRVRCAFNSVRAPLTLSSFLGLFLMCAVSFGCAPSSSTDGGQDSSASNDSLEITEETIRERINGTRVGKVPEENGAGEPISWGFGEDEPKEIAVVEKQLKDGRVFIVLDIKTQSSPRARDPRYLAGQIRTEWKLETGWVLRRWEIIRIENISMKYKNLPKPPAPNSNG